MARPKKWGRDSLPCELVTLRYCLTTVHVNLTVGYDRAMLHIDAIEMGLTIKVGKTSVSTACLTLSQSVTRHMSI